MNISNVSSTNPTLPPLTLNQEIALLDKEIQEIKLVQDGLDSGYNRIMPCVLGIFYAFNLIGMCFSSDYESTTDKVREIAKYTFIMSGFAFCARHAPLYMPSFENYSKLEIRFKNYLKENSQISDFELEANCTILRKYMPDNNEEVYLWDIADKLTSRNYRINLDKIMRVYKSELGMTLPLELWREITHLIIKKTIHECK